MQGSGCSTLVYKEGFTCNWDCTRVANDYIIFFVFNRLVIKVKYKDMGVLGNIGGFSKLINEWWFVRLVVSVTLASVFLGCALSGTIVDTLSWRPTFKISLCPHDIGSHYQVNILFSLLHLPLL